MSVLKLEKRGLSFNPDDERVKFSDIGNYRVTTEGYTVKGNDGIDYHLEIMRGDKRIVRTTSNWSGKPLKHPVTEIISTCKAYCTATFIKDGMCYRKPDIGKDDYPYTERGILDLVNSFSAEHYDTIEYTYDVNKNNLKRRFTSPQSRDGNKRQGSKLNLMEVLS